MPLNINNIPMKYELRGDANIIKPEDIVWLVPTVLGSDEKSGYAPSSHSYTIYIDEKFYSDNIVTVSGVLVRDSSENDLHVFLRKLKKRFRPEKKYQDWYIKGSSEWFEHPQQTINDDSYEESAAKWLCFSELLEEKALDYKLIGATINTDRYSFKTKDHYFEKFYVLFITLFQSLEQYKHAKLTFVTDDIHSQQLDAFVQAINEIKEQGFNVKKYKILSKIVHPNNKSALIMQFADMALYLLSRYLYPSFEKDHRGSILIGFEQFTYDNSTNEILSLEPEEAMRRAVIHQKICKIYHHLRLHVFKNISCHKYHAEGTRLSSFCNITDTTDRNFADKLDHHISAFCSTMKLRQPLLDVRA